MDDMQNSFQHASEPDNPFRDNLQTISANALQKADIPALRFIVDSILPEGLAILVAPPKFGKSWMSLDLCLSVASGKTFLDHKIERADVLYLALEDSFRRLQSRQEKLLQGSEAPANCYFAIAAATVDGALSNQIDAFMKEHPRTGLIIIDVLARVRSQGISSKADAYKMDYSDMGILKRLADHHHICVLVVHHTRKMRDESDVFNDISGSNGITGAADTALVLCKDKRADSRATLHIIGRDVEAQEMIIEMGADCRWRRIGSPDEVKAQFDLNIFLQNPFVSMIRERLEDSTDNIFKATSEQLRGDLYSLHGSCAGLDSAKKIGRFIADEKNQRLFRAIGIVIEDAKEQNARWKIFRRIDT